MLLSLRRSELRFEPLRGIFHLGVNLYILEYYKEVKVGDILELADASYIFRNGVQICEWRKGDTAIVEQIFLEPSYPGLVPFFTIFIPRTKVLTTVDGIPYYKVKLNTTNLGKLLYG